SGWIFLISVVALTAGVAFGMMLRDRLPKQHLDGAKEVVRLGAGFLATLSAVLISLMITSAKSSYDTQDGHFRTLAAYLVETDQLLVQYGPETLQIRILMRQPFPRRSTGSGARSARARRTARSPPHRWRSRSAARSQPCRPQMMRSAR